MKPIDHHRRPKRSPRQIHDQPDSSSVASGLSEGFGPRETRIGPAAPIRTMVINDSLGLLFEISRLLMAQPGIDLIGMMSDEDEVWEELATLQPELIVWTLQTRRTERLEKISALRRLLPSLRIVIIGADNRPELVGRCQDQGVNSFIPRSRLRYDLWPAIQRQFTRSQQFDN